MNRLSAALGLILFAGAPSAESGGSNCSNSVQGNNGGPLTNNCPTIYMAPPPLANMIYQNGREVADTDAPLTINSDGSCSLDEIYNTKLDIFNSRAPVKYGEYSFVITKWKPFAMMEGTAHGMHSNVMRDVECEIVR
jgi:hypothetical protein